MKGLSSFPLYFLTLIFTFSFFLSCEKEPQIITNTVTETDTIFVNQIDTFTITLTDTLNITEFVKDTATTFILTRHAETTGSGSTRSLSVEGRVRAEELKRILNNVPLQSVYSTSFNRTRQTAQPTADDHSLNIEIYNASRLDLLAEQVLTDFGGETVLVVGHSNTTPDLLNELTGTTAFSDLPETEYDNLYVVTVFEIGRAEVIHLKYGE